MPLPAIAQLLSATILKQKLIRKLVWSMIWPQAEKRWKVKIQNIFTLVNLYSARHKIYNYGATMVADVLSGPIKLRYNYKHRSYCTLVLINFSTRLIAQHSVSLLYKRHKRNLSDGRSFVKTPITAYDDIHSFELGLTKYSSHCNRRRFTVCFLLSPEPHERKEDVAEGVWAWTGNSIMKAIWENQW